MLFALSVEWEGQWFEELLPDGLFLEGDEKFGLPLSVAMMPIVQPLILPTFLVLGSAVYIVTPA